MQIIAIHGNGQDKSIFTPLKKLNLITFNLPGHGDEICMKEYSINKYAEFINNKITDDCILIGHSLGGHIALESAIRTPKIKALISIGAPPINVSNLNQVFMPHPMIAVVYSEVQPESQLRAFIEAGSNSRINDDLLFSMFRSQSPLARTSFAQSLAMGIEDEEVKVQKLKIPAMFIFGSDEKLVNTKYVREMNLPNYTEISGGHNIMLDNPEALQEEIIQFLHRTNLI
jgi:pimeloyl-ACP methyl ester carboxylesterase